MRRKSTRNLAKSSPEKVQPAETSVRKLRRTSKRRRRSSSSASGNSEEEPEVKGVDQAPLEDNLKEDVSVGKIQDFKKVDLDLKSDVVHDLPSSPNRRSRDSLNKSVIIQEEHVPSKEGTSFRRSRRRGSPKAEEPTCQEDEDKRGKGKSKGKHKSKIEKSHPVNESEARNECEISENVQVTPESPQTNTDNRVDNDHVTVIESIDNSEDGNKVESDKAQIDEEINKIKHHEGHSSSKDIKNLSNNKSKSKTILKRQNHTDVSTAVPKNPSDEKIENNENSSNQSPEKLPEETSTPENDDKGCVGTWENEQIAKTTHNLEEYQEQNVEPSVGESSGENDKIIEKDENELVIEHVKIDEEIIVNAVRDIVRNVVEDIQNKITVEQQENEKAHYLSRVMEKDSSSRAIEEDSSSKVMEEDSSSKVMEEDSSSKALEEDSLSRATEEDSILRVLEETTIETTKEELEEKTEEYKSKSHKQKIEISRFCNTNEKKEVTVHRRKWGNASIGLHVVIPHLFQIDIDCIKTICPNFQFLDETEVKLQNTESKDRRKSITEHRERRKSERKVSVDDTVRPVYDTQLSERSNKSDDNLDSEIDNSNIIAMNRKISIVDDSASKLKPPPSPARNPVSEVLYITNLVRPFTLKQLKELLERTGRIIDNGFWTDRIKSKCYVQYDTVTDAEATRNALHGVHWPIGNGKKLIIDYATPNDLETARNPPPPPPPPPPPVPAVVPDVNKNEKETKEPQKKPKQEEERKVQDRERDREKERHRNEHVREWDVGKENVQRRHSRSHERHDKRRHSHHSPSPIDDFISRKHKKIEEQLPQKLMDDLFQKTKATPSIYWQPLTPEEIATKQEQRLERMAAHKRRMEETSRNRAEYGRGGPYRRRYD